MMISGSLRVVGTILAISMAATPVLADDYVYKGDCQRAAVVAQERTIDKLMPYNNYYGVQRLEFPQDSCGRTDLAAYKLTVRSRSTTEIVFDVVRGDTYAYKSTGNCADPQNILPYIAGGAIMKLYTKNSSGICEVYIWTEWKDTNVSDNKIITFATKVSRLDDNTFAIILGTNQTPMAFYGKN